MKLQSGPRRLLPGRRSEEGPIDFRPDSFYLHSERSVFDLLPLDRRRSCQAPLYSQRALLTFGRPRSASAIRAAIRARHTWSRFIPCRSNHSNFRHLDVLHCIAINLNLAAPRSASAAAAYSPSSAPQQGALVDTAGSRHFRSANAIRH